MAFLDSPDSPKPRVSPELLVGVASPLWSYFGAAAAGGVAFWWMTRWTQPVNLEAIFERAIAPLPSPELVSPPEVVEAAVESVEEAVEVVAEATAVPEPTLIEPPPVPEPLPETVLAAEPVAEATSEPGPDFQAAPKPKARKAPTPFDEA